MWEKLKNSYDEKYSKISLYVVKTVILLTFLGLVMFWVLGKAGRVLTFLMAVLNPLLTGLMLAYLFSPLVRKCEERLFAHISKRTLRRGLSVAMTLGVVVVLVLVLIGVLIVTITRSITSIQPEQYMEFLKTLGGKIDELGTNLEQKLSDMGINAGSVGGFITGILGSIKNVASTLLISVILAIYFLMDSGIKEYWGKILVLFTDDRTRGQLQELANDADHVFSGYIRGQVIDALLVGTLSALTLTLVRIPYGPVIGLLTGIGNLIPYVGPIVGFGSLIVVCLSEGSLLHLAIGGVILAVVMLVDGNVINPRLLSANVEVHPVLVILALLAGGEIGGIIGMLIGVPCAAFLKVQFDKYVEARRKRQEEHTSSEV